MTTIVSGSQITFNDNTTQNTSAYGGGFAFRNRIINGDCRIDQRNAGASVTPTTNVYTLDRWYARNTQSSKYSVQQNAGSVTPPAGFKNYLGMTSLSAYSVASGDFFAMQHNIEGLNVADFDWGTANAKTITLSFWVRSSLTGTFGGCLGNYDFNRSYPFTYTISSANTWEQKTITIAGDTTGTWKTDNLTGIALYLGIGVGSTYSGTVGSWTGSGLISATGATSVVGTNGATFYITGVQLEKGSTATSFDYRPYSAELAMCQRYCPVWETTANGDSIAVGQVYGSTTGLVDLPFPVTPRAKPSGISTTGSFVLLNSTASGLAATLTFNASSLASMRIVGTVSSGLTTGNATALGTSAASKIIATGCEL